MKAIINILGSILASLALSLGNCANAAVDIGLLKQYVYLAELLVIGLVALALIVVALGIVRRKRQMNRIVHSFREEVKQEKAMLFAAAENLESREQQLRELVETALVSLPNHLSQAEQPQAALQNADQAVAQISLASSTQNAQQEMHGILPVDTEITVEPELAVDADAEDSRLLAANGEVKEKHLGPRHFVMNMQEWCEEEQKKTEHISSSVLNYLDKAAQAASSALGETTDQQQMLSERLEEAKRDFGAADGTIVHDKNDHTSRLLEELYSLNEKLHSLRQHQDALAEVCSESFEAFAELDESSKKAPDEPQTMTA